MTTASSNTGADFESRYRDRPGQGEGKPGDGRANRRGAFRPKAPLGKLFDRQPPASEEAEQSLLGSMILDPRTIGDVIQFVRGGEAFYNPNHGLIFDALVGTYDRHHTGDLTQLNQTLRDKGVLDLIGGTDYLVRLAQETPTAVNAIHYARIVADKYRLRKLIDTAGEILFQSYHAGAGEEDAATIIDDAERMVFEIAEEENVSDSQSLKQLLDVEILRLEAKERGEASPGGVLTGFHELDTMLGGLQQGEMIIIAARPSMGKTSFALNLAEQIALGTDGPRQAESRREPMPIGVFSLEMSKSALVQRLLSSYTGINSQHIQRSILGATQYDELLLAAERLAEASLFIDDSPALSVTQLRARARRMVAKHGIKCIMIDYLQLLSAPGAAKESRQVEVGAISRGVKALARDLKVPILCLSQLNRGAETRDQNKPRLSDLRESGSLEQDADVVMLLHREEYYHIGDEEWLGNNPDKVGLGEVIIAKQRNGPTGTVKLSWNAPTTRFLNHAPGSDETGFGAAPRQEYQPQRPAAPRPAPRPAARPSGFVEPSAPALPPPPPARPSFGTFAPVRSTGPVQNHRDGGGPDRDEAPTPPPPVRASEADAADPEDEGPAPF